MTLQIQNVSKAFGSKTAVENISFEVADGRVFGLLGLNGAGKSTAIRMILDILTPDKGEILWNGQAAKSQLSASFGYLPEERGLYPHMKVLSQLVMFGRLHGMTKSQALAATRYWLERFQITHYENQFISTLSKGNQQKVQFIASVVHNPPVLILDEPFSGLDPVNTELFKDVFSELIGLKKTILFSSHRLDHVEELSDDVGIIHQSRLVLSGNVEQIVSDMPVKCVRIGTSLNEIQPFLPPSSHPTVRKGFIEIDISTVKTSKLLHDLIEAGVEVSHFELVRPTLHDIFLEKVGESA